MEPQSEVRKTDRVTVMITAESVIAGFMIAYGALNNQMLLYWSDPKNQGSPVTTYLAGVWIYAAVLTCLTSILLLHASLDTNSMEDVRYKLGNYLFDWTILMTGAFIFANVSSIYHFTAMPEHTTYDVPVTPWAFVAWSGFIAYGGFLVFIWALARMAHKKEI